MADLLPVPDDVDLSCYRCRIHGEKKPATKFKWMATPTGGRYRRGWCQRCLVEPDWYPHTPLRKAEAKPNGTDGGLGGAMIVSPERRPIPTGERANASVTGEISHYLGGRQRGWPPPRVVLMTEWGAVVVPVGALNLEE